MRSRRTDDIQAGLRDCAPVLLAVIPFAAVFGTVAVERGMDVVQVLLASASIYAGASQFVMIDLLDQQIAPWVIVLTVGAVNFRHVLYSAAIGRRMGAFGRSRELLAFFFLTDPQFAAAERRASVHGLRPAYWFAFAGLLYASWMVGNLVGVLFGTLIEDQRSWGLDMVLPIYFLALVVSFRATSGFAGILAVSAVVTIATVALVGAPWHILAGGAAGMAFAALRA